MTRSLKYLLVAIAVLTAMVALWYAYASTNGSGGGYETKVVDQGPIERIVSASGAVSPVVTVLVGTQVSGQVAIVDVDFNAQVKKGQRLALIDPQSVQSRVIQAQSDVTAARTQQALQVANVVRAQAQLLKEQRALGRLETLAAKGFASPAQIDAQTASIASAIADVSVAKAQVQNSQANIAAREASLTQAKIDLSRTEILSPIDGIVIERNVDRGQTVAASLQAPTLFKIAQDLSQIQIDAQVDEADIGTVKPGQSVTFSVSSHPQREFRGNVSQVRVGGVSEQSVVTYAVIISAANRDMMLLPGMTASVKILTGSREKALRIPSESLRFRPPASLQATAPSQAAPARGSGRRDAMITELEQVLTLTGTQKSALLAALPKRTPGSSNGQWRRPQEGGERSDSAPRSGGQGGRGFELAITAALKPLLTPDQTKKLDLWQSSRSATRRAQIWVLKAGVPVSVSVLLGINDDRFAEIVSGDIKEGDLVITRYTETGA